MNNQEKLEEAGLLMPAFLATLDPVRVREEIRALLSNGEFKSDILNYTNNAKVMDKRIQAARYEQFIISLMHTRAGLPYLFPCIYFRGRRAAVRKEISP